MNELMIRKEVRQWRKTKIEGLWTFFEKLNSPFRQKRKIPTSH